MYRFLPVLAGLLVLLACASASEWDPFVHAPVRPDLDADSNSAQAYYQRGEALLREEPHRAADAFHWASRLDPSWADPLYARRVALLMAEPRVFSQYMQGYAPLMESPGVEKTDSLYRRALTINPFLHNKHDATALRAVLMWRADRAVRRESPGTRVDRAVLERWIDDFLRTTDPRLNAWLAHSEGRFLDAARHYVRAIERNSGDAGLHADLGRVLFLSGRYQEAGAAMTRAVEVREQTEEEELVRVYESKALFEHSIGLIHEQLGDAAAARDAYARALQEDLSYYPAHIRLGELALSEGDTVTALNELALAAEIQENDPAVLQRYGRLLARAGRLADARARLERAIELEPLFAQPYFDLATVLEAEDRLESAVESYRRYLERAGRRASSRRQAEERLGRLEEVLGMSGPGR